MENILIILAMIGLVCLFAGCILPECSTDEDCMDTNRGNVCAEGVCYFMQQPQDEIDAMMDETGVAEDAVSDDSIDDELIIDSDDGDGLDSGSQCETDEECMEENLGNVCADGYCMFEQEPMPECGDGICRPGEDLLVSRGLCPPCPEGAVCEACPDWDLKRVCPQDCGENECEGLDGYCAHDEDVDLSSSGFERQDRECGMQGSVCWVYRGE